MDVEAKMKTAHDQNKGPDTQSVLFGEIPTNGNDVQMFMNNIVNKVQEMKPSGNMGNEISTSLQTNHQNGAFNAAVIYIENEGKQTI